MVAVGSIAGTGSWNDRHSARSPLVVRLTPRSLKERCGGPAVLAKEKPPVTFAEAMLLRGVSRRHGPKRTNSHAGPTSTVVEREVTPNGRPARTYDRAKAKSNAVTGSSSAPSPLRSR